ncbi:MAG TPA: hypothetical protein PKA63_09030 [Oligoflexia bacterium]|nr:hypothetical protein [Oligoflexia bacterium]HMP48795.1 hypothetical protein [Oligoflexia bacterium]
MINNRKILFETFCYYSISRVAIFIIILLSSSAILESVPAREGLTWHIRFSNIEDTISRFTMTLLSADASWYMEIARYGYPAESHMTDAPRSWVFFPGFPLLVRAAQNVFSYWLFSAVFINAILFLTSLILLYKISINAFDDKKIATGAIALSAFHPFSYFFSTPHSESLFMCSLCGVFYAVQKRSTWIICFCLMICLVSRPTGILVLPGILYWLKDEKFSYKTTIKILAISLIPLCLYFYHLYLITGSPLSWLENQAAWGRSVNEHSFIERIILITTDLNIFRPWSFTLLHIISSVLVLAASIYLITIKKTGWALILVLPLIASLSTGSFLSLSRILMPLPPLYLVFSHCLIQKNTLTPILLASSVFLGAMTLLYSLHASMAMT